MESINKMTRYENWKDLKPLTAQASIGTKCICLVSYGMLDAGDVVTTLECATCPMCKNEQNNIEYMTYYELALLPENAIMPELKTPNILTTVYTEKKQERKIIQLFLAEDVVGALCDDGTAWLIDEALTGWVRLPPITQDGE